MCGVNYLERSQLALWPCPAISSLYSHNYYRLIINVNNLESNLTYDIVHVPHGASARRNRQKATFDVSPTVKSSGSV